jgi:hypothetical protein
VTSIAIAPTFFGWVFMLHQYSIGHDNGVSDLPALLVEKNLR